MDNVAKALLIAGGILIAILIISLGAYFLTSFRNIYSENMNSLHTTRVANFNSKFTSYGTTITGYQAWNIISYAREANNSPSSVSSHVDTDGGILTIDNYEQRLFFMDALLRTYNYSYSYGPEGTVDRIIIN
ncbi:MAG: hypothetical protein IKR04_07075 [Clostridia bacterium]|nr:hypothetical protein [Clostridia bacterium]